MTGILLVLAGLQVFRQEQMQTFSFANGFILTLFVLFSAAQAVCLLTRKLQLKQLGFFLAHAGILAFLLGSLLFYVWGDTVYAWIPVNGTSYNSVQREDGSLLDLGFDIQVNDFTVEKYEPVWDLYEQTENGWEKTGTDFALQDGQVDFGPYGVWPQADLMENGTYLNQILLDDRHLAVCRQADRYYEAGIVLYEPGVKEPRQVSLAVNHTARAGDFKIYLMGYDPASQDSIQVLFKKDPGEWISVAGIAAMIVGIFMLCIFRGRKAVEK